MSSLMENVLLAIAQQALTAGANFCTQAGAVTNSAVGKVAYKEGAQFLANMSTLAKWGAVAATAEFNTQTGVEGTLIAKLPTLPPIT